MNRIFEIKLFFILLFLFFFKSDLLSQSVDTSFSSGNYEVLLENITDENTGEYFLDKMKQLSDNPININRCDAGDLSEIPYIQKETINRILRYREEYGSITSKYALKKIIDNESQYDIINPFIIYREKSTTYIKFSSTNSSTLEKSRGYDSVYLGSALKSINKFIFESIPGHISCGFLTDKDPGEKSFSDFYSGFAAYKDERWNIIAGDFLAGFGYGLCLSKSFMLSKGNVILRPDENNVKSLTPYTSSAESNFMRGLAFSSSFGDLNFSLFYSNNYFDASIDSNDNITSIGSDGYHKTDADLLKKDNLKEKIFGIRSFYRLNNYLFGINFYHNEFSHEMTLNNFYSFKGRESNPFSLDFSAVYEKISIFSELAKAQNEGLALLFGTYLKPMNNIEISMIYRKYPENYINLHANAFSESGTNNEEGLYFGIALKPVSFLKINAYYDAFKFPYRTYFNPLPTSGMDGLVFIELDYFKQHKIYIKYKQKNKEDIFPATDLFNRDIKSLYTAKNQNIRLETLSSFANSLRLKSKVELSIYTVPYKDIDERGILLSEDLHYSISDNLDFSLRYMFFDTDSFNAAIYEYESDVEGIYGNFALSGKGKKYYIMAEYQFPDFLKLSVKFSNIIYQNIKSMGSGYDIIKGNSINKISLNLSLILK
jgi:hypothetical protein